MQVESFKEGQDNVKVLVKSKRIDRTSMLDYPYKMATSDIRKLCLNAKQIHGQTYLSICVICYF